MLVYVFGTVEEYQLMAFNSRTPPFILLTDLDVAGLRLLPMALLHRDLLFCRDEQSSNLPCKIIFLKANDYQLWKGIAF